MPANNFAEVVRTSTGAIFNNAAQAWNHTFYFRSMKPPSLGGGGEPKGRLREEINKEFTSYEKFKDEFSKLAAGHFGSGWAWLTWDKHNKRVGIEQTHDAGTPLTEPSKVPLLCCDVWEHAYYLDRKNDRPAYIKGKPLITRDLSACKETVVYACFLGCTACVCSIVGSGHRGKRCRLETCVM